MRRSVCSCCLMMMVLGSSRCNRMHGFFVSAIGMRISHVGFAFWSRGKDLRPGFVMVFALAANACRRQCLGHWTAYKNQ